MLQLFLYTKHVKPTNDNTTHASNSKLKICCDMHQATLNSLAGKITFCKYMKLHRLLSNLTLNQCINIIYELIGSICSYEYFFINLFSKSQLSFAHI